MGQKRSTCIHYSVRLGPISKSRILTTKPTIIGQNFFQQPMSNCYNGYMVNSNNRPRNHFIQSQPGPADNLSKAV